MIAQMKLDEIALTDPDETAGNVAAEGPEQVIHSIGHAFDLFDDFKVDDYLGGCFASDRRWDQGRAG